MALHGELVLSQQLLPTAHHHSFQLLTVHPFTALLFKKKKVCVRERAGVNVCVCSVVMCQKIKCSQGEMFALKNTTVKVVYMQSASPGSHYVS